MFHIQKVEFLIVDLVCLFFAGEEEEERCQGKWIRRINWRVIRVNWNSHSTYAKEKCQIFNSYKSAVFVNMNQLHWFTICTDIFFFFNLPLSFWKRCLKLGTYFKRSIFHQSEYHSKTLAPKEITASEDKNPLSSHSSVDWSPHRV